MIKEKILVIDDEAGIRTSLRGILEDEGYEIITASNGEDGLELMKGENFDLIFLDIWLPVMNGIEVLEKIKAKEENPQVVMISGHGSVESAVKATKLGAYDYLEKPLSLERVVLAARNSLKQKKLEDENIQLREKFKAKYELVGNSPGIQKLKEEIRTAATATHSRVLIFGENGTGKELVARMIHSESPRREKRFVQINSAAIPDNLMEIELFGSMDSAPLQAERTKKGKLLLAEGGTLYLDEIGEMSLKIQAKIVHFIEDKRYEPLGSAEPIEVDTRIIAATNRDLRPLVMQKKFREDLFFKLNVIPLTVPSLRERKEDIPLLISHFLNYFSIEYNKKQKAMSREAVKAFTNYSWPGNVSELINVIERFVIMVKEDEIKSSHLSLLVEPRESRLVPGFDSIHSLKKAYELFERRYVHKILIRNNWDLGKTAHELNIEKEELDKKIINLGITFLG